MTVRVIRGKQDFSPVVWRVLWCRGCDLRYKHLAGYAPGFGLGLLVLDVKIYLADHPVSLILVLGLFGHVFLILFDEEAVGDE